MQRSGTYLLITGLLVGAAAGFIVALFVAPAGRAPLANAAAASGRTREAADRSTPTSAPAQTDNRVRIVAPPTAAREESRDDATERELAALRARVAELEAEVARLRALQVDRDPACRNLRQVFAANDLKHGALYREIAELVVDDPESVTDDPRRLTRLFLRCIDETGLGAVAPDENGSRRIEPEPGAPEVGFELDHSASDSSTTDESGANVAIRTEQVSFRGAIRLPKSPDGWLGPPFTLALELAIERNSNRSGWCQLRVHDERAPNLVQIEWAPFWSPRESSFSRSPWKGGQEQLQGGPRDFAEQHRLVDELFEQFRSRAP